jgi:hypothetical protein
MKNIILLACLFLPLQYLFAQEEPSRSQVVEFLKKDGKLLQKQYHSIGQIGRIEFENIIICDLVNDEKIGALRIIVSEGSALSSETGRYIGTLDFDEIEDCLKSLKYMKEKTSSTADTYTEYEYLTRDGVKIGVYSGKLKSNPWVFFVRTDRYELRSRETMNYNKIDDVINMIQSASDNLKSLLN